jgi:hypothetical protein
VTINIAAISTSKSVAKSRIRRKPARRGSVSRFGGGGSAVGASRNAPAVSMQTTYLKIFGRDPYL